MNFRDFKFGDSNEPEEEWKIKFREDVREKNKHKKQLPDLWDGLAPSVSEDFIDEDYYHYFIQR